MNDKSVWMTFHLNETINLDELLNVSKVRVGTLKLHVDAFGSLHFSPPPSHACVCHTQYTGEIQDLFDNTDITLATITILTASDRTQLEDFSSQATALDMSGVTEQVGCLSGLFAVQLSTEQHHTDLCVILRWTRSTRSI